MIVKWFGVNGATYDVDRSDNSVWVEVIRNTPLTEIIDSEGDARSLYRVRVNGSAIWNPPFYADTEEFPKMCRVFGTIRDVSGTYASGIDVFFSVPIKRTYLTDAFYTSNEPVSIITSGYWEKNLPVGLSVRIRIPAAKINEIIIIPDLAEVNFASLL